MNLDNKTIKKADINCIPCTRIVHNDYSGALLRNLTSGREKRIDK